MNDNLMWLLHWFYSQCDGDWEHGNGIEMKTTDNHCCSLKICLSETELDAKSFEIVDIHRTQQDWIHCSTNNGIFQASGGQHNLSEILQIFRNWAENGLAKIDS